MSLTMAQSPSLATIIFWSRRPRRMPPRSGGHMTKAAQVDWPDLDVTLDGCERSLGLACHRRAACPRSSFGPWIPISTGHARAFPFAHMREGHLGGDLPVRVFSVSFSGELSFEINTPAGFAEMSPDPRQGAGPNGASRLTAWKRWMCFGSRKGHLSVGTEIDGRRTARDLGLGAMVSDRKDFVGRALLQTPRPCRTSGPRGTGGPDTRGRHEPHPARRRDE